MKILLGHLIGLTPRRSGLLFFEVTLKKFSPHKKSHKTLCSTSKGAYDAAAVIHQMKDAEEGLFGRGMALRWPLERLWYV